MRYFTCIFCFILCFSIEVFSQDSECATNDNDPIAIQTLIKNIAKMNQSPSLSGRFPLVNVPVQIHLFKTSAGVATITLAQIRADIASANVKYANAGLKLFECVAPEIIQDDGLYDYHISQEAFVFANHYTTNAINLYFPNSIHVTTTSTVCGYSKMPPSADFVFIAASCTANGSTFAHELGHYFGLPHTHSKWNNVGELVNGSNCSIGGDLICDTPADPDLTNKVNSSCGYTGTAKDANNMSYTPNTHMMMSYSTFACRNIFSSMQYTLMNTTYNTSRNYLDCGITSINAINTNESAIVIFPNPSSNNFSISISENEIVGIKLFTIEGKEIYKENGVSRASKIDVSSFENGLYLLQIDFNDKIVSKPLVIMNQ
jgi:hypothetical protein